MSDLAKHLEGLIDTREFREGDLLRVTGDTAQMAHHFEVGTIVEAVHYMEEGRAVGGNMFPCWDCASRDGSRGWYVAVQDLESAAPTDEEIQTAIRSIERASNAVQGRGLRPREG